MSCILPRLRDLASRFSRPRGRAAPRPGGRRVVPSLECLEQRTLPSLFTNLIVNGDAEAGPGDEGYFPVAEVPGWTRDGNFTVGRYDVGLGFPTAESPGPQDRGANFFAGGPSNPSSSVSQAIDVGGCADLIDAGGVSYELAGYLGGYDFQEDNAVLRAYFRGEGGDLLDLASIGPVTAADRGRTTGLMLRTASGSVPPGTRSIDVVLSMTRDAGSYNDGYADNLSLILSPGGAVNRPPVLDSLEDRAVSSDQPEVVVPLSAADPDGDPLTFTAAAQSLAYVLAQQTGPVVYDSSRDDYGGLGERWLLSGDTGQWYFVRPDGEYYLWDGEPSATGTLLGDVGASYWDDPTRLEAPPADEPRATLGVSGDTLTVTRDPDWVSALVITVTVSDGSLTDSLTFTLTVNG